MHAPPMAVLGLLSYSAAVCLENVIVFPALFPRLGEMGTSAASRKARPSPASPLAATTHSRPSPTPISSCIRSLAPTRQLWLGLSMGAFSMGRASSALLLNLREHTRSSIRVAATVCFGFSLAAAALFFFAATPLQLVLSRLLAGLGAGALSLMLITLVTISSPEERTNARGRRRRRGGGGGQLAGAAGG